jgi:hypothetical protein
VRFSFAFSTATPDYKVIFVSMIQELVDDSMAGSRFTVPTFLQPEIAAQAKPHGSKVNLGALVIGVMTLACVAGLNSRSFAQQMGSLKGTLSDPQGAAMPNVHIQLRWNPRQAAGGVTTGKLKQLPRAWQPRKKWLQVATDRTGKFSVELPTGNWDLFAYLNGFAPACRVVSIEAGTTTEVELRLAFAPMSVD